MLELEFDGQQNENEMKSQIISMNNRDENCVSERERDTHRATNTEIVYSSVSE